MAAEMPKIEGLKLGEEMSKYTTADNDNVLGKKFPSLDTIEEITPTKAGKVKVVFCWAQLYKAGFKFMPLYSDLEDKLGDKASIVGLSMDNEAKSAKKFLEDPGKKYSTVFKTTFGVSHDTGRKIQDALGPLLLGPVNLPHCFILNEEGVIVWHQDHSQIGATVCTYMDQIERQILNVYEGKPLESNGARPEESDSEDEDEDDEGDGEGADFDDFF